MRNEVRLYNVMDTRTGKIHSVAVVSEKNVRYFVPIFKTEEPAESNEGETPVESNETEETADSND